MARKFDMDAAVKEFHARVKRGESMADAFNEITDRIEPGKLSNWNIVEEFGRRVGYQPWKRILNPTRRNPAPSQQSGAHQHRRERVRAGGAGWEWEFHSFTSSVKMRTPEIVGLALARVRSGETISQAVNWVWMQASKKERDSVDEFLVATKHPSAYEAGTQEQRFRQIVTELSRESNPFRLSAKDPADMSAAEINRELDRISTEDSKVNQELIDAGRGHEKYWDILKKDDPLSRRALALTSRRHKLKIEIERRAGPGMSRLPRGFGPRKSNPAQSSLERESSWVIVNRQTGEPILETFQKSVADKVNTKKYEVVPILQWLQRVNQKAREK